MIARNSRTFQHGDDQSLAIPDDGCRLVLGLGPTPICILLIVTHLMEIKFMNLQLCSLNIVPQPTLV